MRGTLMLLISTAFAGIGLTSCHTQEPARKPVPPVSEHSKLPWSSQGTTTGGQFGMLQQNQYRR